jgi:ABC-type nitrate/sulfonate/bicarbonate transport system substrate-binding protein
MRVGIVSRTATYEPLYRLGDAVELVELGSTAAGVDALVLESIDVAATCPDALIASAAPLRIGGGLVDRPPTTIVASPSVADVAGLRGLRIGTTAAQGSVSIFLRAVLRAHGLARGDYAEVVCGPTPAQAAALERGEIDAAMLTAPFDAQLAARGFRVLVDVGDELGACAFTTLNVREGWTASARWRSLARALERAIRSGPSAIAYDVRLDARAVERLLELMRADGIAVRRGLADVIDDGAALRASPSR